MEWRECRENIFGDYQRIKFVLGGRNIAIIIKIFLFTQYNFIF